MTFEEIADQLLSEMDQIENEARTVFDKLVLSLWDTEPKRFPSILYGLIMKVFGMIDLASVYWRGEKGEQTDRMRAFMDRYLSTCTEANDVALQMWRHTLMHTGKPRRLLDEKTNLEYSWLLHWSSKHLNPLTHYTFEENGMRRKLNMTLLDLIDSVKRSITEYLDELRKDQSLQANCLGIHSEIELQSFKRR